MKRGLGSFQEYVPGAPRTGTIHFLAGMDFDTFAGVRREGLYVARCGALKREIARFVGENEEDVNCIGCLAAGPAPDII